MVGDADGGFTRVHGIVQDITEQAAAHAALQRSEARLNAAERVARMGSWEQDLITGETWVSPTLRRMLGVSPETPAETVRAILSNALHPDHRLAAETKRARLMQTGEPFDGIFRVILSSGETRLLRGIAEAERDASGRMVCIRATLQDITEQSDGGG
jgi:PAS domain-containing protein